MKTTKTDLDVFLEFCGQRGITPTLQKHSTSTYILPPSVLSITYFGMVIEPPEISVYFSSEGRWTGGTNWLWDERLPWVAQKRKRSKAKMSKP